MTGGTPYPVTRVTGSLPAPDRSEVERLADEVAAADGTHPLSEDAVLRLRPDTGPAPTHLLARDPGRRLAGYAQVAPVDGGATGELFVGPAHRRQGLGRLLLTTAAAVVPSAAAAGGNGAAGGHGGGDRDDTGADRPRLRVWAHGDHPGAAALARALGFDRVRTLYQLRRPLTDPVPAPELPAGVRVRAFRPGGDESAWLRLNARAFADHPEQGRWTAADLHARQAEPWFDPAGFLLAVRDSDGALLGFHWTKVHGPGNAHHPGPIGEVYVVGVDPAAHGTGLGTALTLAGLRHLRDRGLDTAMLFVDGDNRPAVALYRKLGFTEWSVDVMYEAPPGIPAG